MMFQMRKPHVRSPASCSVGFRNQLLELSGGRCKMIEQEFYVV